MLNALSADGTGCHAIVQAVILLLIQETITIQCVRCAPRLAAALSWMTMLSRKEATVSERMFPIQRERGAKPHPTQIPWSLAELAYSVYSARYGTSQSLERLAERHGFGPSEMDDFLPDWRERCDEIRTLRDERDRLARVLEGLSSIIPHQHCRTCNQYADEIKAAMTPARGGQNEC